MSEEILAGLAFGFSAGVALAMLAHLAWQRGLVSVARKAGTVWLLNNRRYHLLPEGHLKVVDARIRRLCNDIERLHEAMNQRNRQLTEARIAVRKLTYKVRELGGEA